MSCPGLHCPGCTGGQSLGVLAAAVGIAVLADETVQWVAERIWWIAGTLAVCFALAVAASMWLEAWAERRGARFAARHGILSRADVIAGAVPPATLRPAVLESEWPALAPRQVTVNIFGVPPSEAAAIIRQALPGEAITERESS